MSDFKSIAQQFLDALVANDAARFDAILAPDAGLRLSGVPSSEAHRPRERVVRRLLDESAMWRDARVQMLSAVSEGDCVAMQFRIQATEHERYVEHNRAAFLTLREDRIEMIDLYAPAPIPSARRDKHWIAPATLTDDEINRLFDSMQYAWDVYEWMPPIVSGTQSLSASRWGSGDAHPGSNGIANVRWSAAEADAKIEEVIAYHRARHIGFCWFVNPFDTPLDLRERLERHGFALAGDQAIMARVRLDRLDIPVNPEVTIDLVDGSDDRVIEEKLRIIATCFNWTPAQVDERRPGMYERLKNPKFREEEIHYLARLGGAAVADARIVLRGGIAYLGGASTLPEFRSRRIYSTLLRRRLEDAHARGYHIAAIHAEPMSRRVVSRYGFREYAKAYLYGWMPVMDLNVIKSLVPDD
ncbi:MAG: GNAT family N-acetyltransferase [Chloroflexi bacterium]|nr:GNAT family N-acetyltransferase [Chloroflexota bacterium]